MTPQEKFSAMLLKFFQKSNQTFDELDEEIYFGGMKPIGVEKALEALMTIARDKGMSRVPSVGDILAAAGFKRPEAIDEANEIVGRLIFSIGRFGGYKPKEAKLHIGDIGWEVVERNGGWELICNMEEDQLNTFRAQMRDQIKAVSSMASVGRLDQPKNFNILPIEVAKLLDGQR